MGWKDNVKMDIKEIWCGLDSSSCSGQNKVGDCCVHGNGILGSIKGGIFD
jgi:hypothetical protein